MTTCGSLKREIECAPQKICLWTDCSAKLEFDVMWSDGMWELNLRHNVTSWGARKCPWQKHHERDRSIQKWTGIQFPWQILNRMNHKYIFYISWHLLKKIFVSTCAGGKLIGEANKAWGGVVGKQVLALVLKSCHCAQRNAEATA